MRRNTKMGTLVEAWTNTDQGNIPLVKISMLQSVAHVGPLDVDGDGKYTDADVRALDLESVELAADSMKRPNDWAAQETNAAAQVVIANTKRELIRKLGAA